MRAMTFLSLCCALVVVSLYPAGANAEVRVNFVNPEKYTDANLYGGYGERGREPALREIERDLQRLGQRYLKPGEVLTVDILNVDLAGQFEPWRAPAYDVRFMREVTWPQFKLRYRLEGTARPPLVGEELISDRMYLWRAAGRASGTVMPYEKAMLEDWFETRFAKQTPSS